MSITKNKQLIKEAVINVLENMNATEETYAKYFSENYIQYVDGKSLDYNGLVAHMKAQKQVLQSVKVTYKYMIAEDDLVATLHIVNAVKKDGGLVEAQVNAVFRIADDKIVLCDELTRLIKGTKSDEDLGSRK